MKKIISIIALLLILCFAFAACDQYSANAETNPDIQNGKDDIEGGPVIDGLDPYKVDYSDIIRQWRQYISFNSESVLNSNVKVESVLENKDEYTVSHHSYLLQSHKTENIGKILNETDTEPTVVLRKNIVSIYDMRTGSLRNTYVSSAPVVQNGEILDSETYSVKDFVSYDIDYFDTYGFYRVAKTVRVLREDYVPVDGAEPTLGDYVNKTTYSFYGFGGDVLLENSESDSFNTRYSVSHYNERYLLDLADKTYLVTFDGEIIKEFPLEEEYDIPVYNENAITLRDGYTYFEAYDFKYVLSEANPVTQKLGDLMMYTVPGMTVTVLDENYNVLVDYSTTCYHVAGYAVLGNGNLYVCEYELLPSTATEFDFELADMKFNAVHKIVNPQSKKVEAIELDYVVAGLFNNVTTSIRSFTTITTANVDASTSSGLMQFKSLMDTCTVKDGYTLAQVQKIEEGGLATESVFVVFDDKMNIVAELPKFMPNQLGYASFVTDGMMLVNTTATDNKTVSYIVDTNAGVASLFVHELLGGDDVKMIEGGYYFNGIIYDTKWNVLCDLSEESYMFEKVYNGKVYFTHYDEEGTRCLSYAKITDSDSYSSTPAASISVETVCKGNSIITRDDYVINYVEYEVQVDEFTTTIESYTDYINYDGVQLLTSGVDFSESRTANGETAFYSGTSSVHVTSIDEGLYMAEYTVTYTLTDMSGVSASNAANFPASYTYTTYYVWHIVKTVG